MREFTLKTRSSNRQKEAEQSGEIESPEVNTILTSTLVSGCLIRGDVTPLLIEGETSVAVYKTIRETAVFTNLQLIVRDAQGL